MAKRSERGHVRHVDVIVRKGGPRPPRIGVHVVVDVNLAIDAPTGSVGTSVLVVAAATCKRHRTDGRL